MSFEFNGLSRSGVLCGEDFIRYRLFKDSPEEVLVDEEFDWGALWGNVAVGLGFVTLVTGAVAYCATIAFTGGASAVFAPYVMGGLTAVGGSWLVVSQAEKDYARGEVSNWTTYANCGLAGSASGALAGYAFCMAPYAAPTLLYGTGAGYMGSMAGLSEEMMIDLAEAALYAVNFSNILVKGSDMVESTTGKNALKDALGEDAYRMLGQASEAGAAVTVIAGLSNPYYYVKNNQAAHFEQVPRAGEGGSNSYSGEEWCRYFRETYGNNNVTWENATPSQLARSWQGSGKYIGIDEYTDVTVSKGTILYRGEPNGTEYFTTLDAIEQSGRNATTIFEGLQVEKNPIHGYRGEMQGYLFNEDIASAYGITNANPQFGNGGLPQYYIPDVQDLISKGILTTVDNIKLYK